MPISRGDSEASKLHSARASPVRDLPGLGHPYDRPTILGDIVMMKHQVCISARHLL
jgi:hypothetical protein